MKTVELTENQVFVLTTLVVHGMLELDDNVTVDPFGHLRENMIDAIRDYQEILKVLRK
jgi:hypothetical protein